MTLPKSSNQAGRACAAIVDRLTSNGAFIETGAGSYRLASTRAGAEEPVKAG